MDKTQEKEFQKITQQIFKQIDLDGSGEIDSEELRVALTKIAQKMNLEVPEEDEITEILEEFDENGDGLLQYEEFQNFVKELFAFTSSSDHKNQKEEEQERNLQAIKDKRRRSSIINNRLFKKIRQSEIKFDAALFLVSQRQSRLSTKLGENLNQLAEDIELVDIPRFADKKSFIEEKRNRSRKRQESFIQYQKKKEVDSKFIEQEKQILKKDQFGSVYSVLSPQQKKPVKEKSFIDSDKAAESLYNDSTREQSPDSSPKSKATQHIRTKSKTEKLTKIIQPYQNISKIQQRKEEFRKKTNTEIFQNYSNDSPLTKKKTVLVQDKKETKYSEVQSVYDKKKRVEVKDWVSKNYK